MTSSCMHALSGLASLTEVDMRGALVTCPLGMANLRSFTVLNTFRMSGRGGRGRGGYRTGQEEKERVRKEGNGRGEGMGGREDKGREGQPKKGRVGQSRKGREGQSRKGREGQSRKGRERVEQAEKCTGFRVERGTWEYGGGLTTFRMSGCGWRGREECGA